MIEIEKTVEYNDIEYECIIYGWNGAYSDGSAEWGEEEIFIFTRKGKRNITDDLSEETRRNIVYEMLSIAYDDSREDMARRAM